VTSRKAWVAISNRGDHGDWVAYKSGCLWNHPSKVLSWDIHGKVCLGGGLRWVIPGTESRLRNVHALGRESKHLSVEHGGLSKYVVVGLLRNPASRSTGIHDGHIL
jgi:hypothetical protein